MSRSAASSASSASSAASATATRRSNGISPSAAQASRLSFNAFILFIVICDFGKIGPHELAQHTVIVNVVVKTLRELVDALVEVCLQDSTMKGYSVSQKLKRNVRENNCIFTLKHRRSVRCSQEHVHVVLYTMLDESQRDVRLDAVVE